MIYYIFFYSKLNVVLDFGIPLYYNLKREREIHAEKYHTQQSTKRALQSALEKVTDAEVHFL